jgi:hypothetical protein
VSCGEDVEGCRNSIMRYRFLNLTIVVYLSRCILYYVIDTLR